MKCEISGKFLSSREYQYKQTNKTTGEVQTVTKHAVQLFDGESVVEVFSCPSVTSKFGEVIRVPASVILTKNNKLFCFYHT